MRIVRIGFLVVLCIIQQVFYGVAGETLVGIHQFGGLSVSMTVLAGDTVQPMGVTQGQRMGQLGGVFAVTFKALSKVHCVCINMICRNLAVSFVAGGTSAATRF